MKALKEKRIRLRSLWRRGLVILSLFALVFASCNSSGGDDDNKAPVNGKVPLEIRVKTAPPKTFYEGIAADYTGMVLEVRYDSAPLTWEPLSDLRDVVFSPKYAPRVGSGYGGSANFTVGLVAGGQPVVYTTLSKSVVNLVHPGNQNWTANDSYSNAAAGAEGSSWTNGAQITVTPAGSYTKKYYVDDFPNLSDLSHFTAMGNYMDGTMQPIPLNMDMRWEIRPRYDNKDKNPSTGKGDLVFYIGGTGDSFWGATTTGGYAPNNGKRGDASTVAVPLDEVYHVTKIEVTNPDVLKTQFEETNPFFFWEDDSAAAWLTTTATGTVSGRAAKAEIKVTYSNGDTRDFDMEKALRLNTVWYNDNPDGTYRPFAVRGIKDTVEKVLGTEKSSVVWPNYKAPQISFYYRGYYAFVDAPIFYKFASVEAILSDADQAQGYVLMDMAPQDNDNFGDSAAAFAKKITVKAHFTSASGLDATKTLDYEALRGPGVTNSDFDVTTPTNPNWRAKTSSPASPGSATNTGGTPQYRWYDYEYNTALTSVASLNFSTQTTEVQKGKPYKPLAARLRWSRTDSSGATPTVYYGPTTGLAYPDYLSAMGRAYAGAADPLFPYGATSSIGGDSLGALPAGTKSNAAGNNTGTNPGSTTAPMTTLVSATPVPTGVVSPAGIYRNDPTRYELVASQVNYSGGPMVYSMNFGDTDARKPSTANGAKYVLGPFAWGVCADPSNNGKVKNVVIYYTPGITTGYDAITGLTFATPTTNTVKRYNVPVQWENIPPLK